MSSIAKQTPLATSITSFDIMPTFGDITQYLNFVNTIPLISQEHESQLINNYRINKCKKSAHRLIVAHLRLSAAYALKYSNRARATNDVADYIQAANYGLMKALDTYNPVSEIRFASYAIFRIKEEIINHYINNLKIVKIGTTANQRKIVMNIKKYSLQYDKDISQQMVAFIANDLNVKPEEVYSVYSRMFKDVSYEAITDKSEEAFETYHNFFIEATISNDADPLDVLTKIDDKKIYGTLFKAIDKLDDRAKDIITLRHLVEDKATLADLSKKHGISGERIRQIETDSLKKLKSYMLN